MVRKVIESPHLGGRFSPDLGHIIDHNIHVTCPALSPYQNNCNRQHSDVQPAVRCRRLMCWNSASRDLQHFEITESGSEVNLLIEGVCGEPTIDFPHIDVP